MSTFLSLVNRLTSKNIVFTTNIHYLWNVTDFEGVILKKSIHVYEEFIHLHEKSGGRIFTKQIVLGDFKLKILAF